MDGTPAAARGLRSLGKDQDLAGPSVPVRRYGNRSRPCRTPSRAAGPSRSAGRPAAWPRKKLRITRPRDLELLDLGQGIGIHGQIEDDFFRRDRDPAPVGIAEPPRRRRPRRCGSCFSGGRPLRQGRGLFRVRHDQRILASREEGRGHRPATWTQGHISERPGTQTRFARSAEDSAPSRLPAARAAGRPTSRADKRKGSAVPIRPTTGRRWGSAAPVPL